MIGKQLLHYKIIEELGRGGMGIVYLADDTKLNRKVAIKFLPSHIASNSSDRERFKIEAQAAAALNHPNIATIHNIEEDDNEIFIVMEYIEGHELKNLVGTRHAVSLQQTINYSIQIAKGLHTAHKKGIIHRDIKSSNIMVTDDGNVKIMDFGLARIGEGSQLTRTHSTMGTMAYMSPEQVQGESADPQSDIWSFGVVLYEMLTGKLPFEGKNEPAVIYAITNNQPVFDEIENEALRAIVKKCLQKDKKDRYQSVFQILNNLQGEKEPSSVMAPVETETEQKKRLQSAYFKWGAAIGLVFLIALYFILFDIKQSDNFSPMKTSRFTSYPSVELYPALSPDGKSVAYSWVGLQKDNLDIYVQRIDGGNPVRVTTHNMLDLKPAWSWDGRYIAFTRQLSTNMDSAYLAIYITPSLGGREQKIAAYHDGGLISALSWSKDNKFIYYSTWSTADSGTAIYRISIETSRSEQLFSVPTDVFGDLSPRISADGRYLGFIRQRISGSSDIFIFNMDNKEVQRVTHEDVPMVGFCWNRDSRSVLFSANLDGTSSLWKVDIDGGKPQKILSGLNIGEPDFSAVSNCLVYQELINGNSIWKINLHHPQHDTLLISSSGDNYNPVFSPDGKKITFSSNRKGSWNLWLCESDGTNPTQLTFFEKKARPAHGIWSPSGNEILLNFGDQNIYFLNASGGGASEEISNVGQLATWAQDGEHIYASVYPEYNLYMFSKDGKEKKHITSETGLYAQSYKEYIYYINSWNEREIWRVHRDGGKEEPLVQAGNDISIRAWSIVSGGIYFVRGDDINASLNFYDFKSRQIRTIRDLPMVGTYMTAIDIDPEERYLLYPKKEEGGADIILVENFRAD